MATISVELPGDLQAFVDSQLRTGQFNTASDYVAALVTAARKNRSALESQLLDGLHSGPAEEWTKQEWTEIRQRVMQRLPKRPGAMDIEAEFSRTE